jgi:ParB-like chromosome segregation protein Spo0J
MAFSGDLDVQALTSEHLDQFPVLKVPIGSLLPADSPRRSGENLEHARALAESEAPLLPIVVHRPTMRVIDGMHRLRAATLRGDDQIEIRFFDGDDADAFVLAVQTNIVHGLPLPVSDRKAAAARIVRTHPHWSDRAIASASGLSAKTVAAIRHRPGAEDHGQRARIGRDGRLRSLNAEEGRAFAAEMIEANPGASLREIARKANISPETVRDVRARLRRGESPLPSPGRRTTAGAAGPGNKSGLGADGGGCAPFANNGGGQILPDESANTLNSKVPGGGDRARTILFGPAQPEINGGRRLPGDADVGSMGVSGAALGGDHGVTVRALRADPSLRLTEGGRALLRLLDTGRVVEEHGQQLLNSIPAHCRGKVAAAAQGCSQAWQEFEAEIKRAGTLFPEAAAE